MTSSFGRQTIAAGPNVFPDPYEKYYNKKDREFAQLVARVANQGKEEVARANQEKLSTIIEPLGPLSKSLGTIVKQRKAAAAKAELRDNKEQQLKIQKLVGGDKTAREQLLATLPKWSRDVKDVKRQQALMLKTYTDKETPDGKPNPYAVLLKNESLLNFYKNSSAAELIRTSEIIARQKVYNAYSTYNIGVQTNGSGLQTEYNRRKDDPQGIQNLFIDHTIADLNELGFDDEFVAANFLGDIQKIARSKAVSAGIDYNQVVLSQTEKKNIASLKHAVQLALNPDAELGNTDAVAERYSELVKETVNESKGITTAIARDMNENLLLRMAQAEQLPDAAIHLLSKGIIPHESGKIIKTEEITNPETGEVTQKKVKYATGDILLSEGFSGKLQAAVNWRDTKVLEQKVSNGEEALKLAKSQYLQDGDEQAWDEAKGKAIQILPQSNQELKDALNFDLKANSQERYDAQKAEWDRSEERGDFATMTDAQLKNEIPHDIARKRYQERAGFEKAALDKIGYKDDLDEERVHSAVNVQLSWNKVDGKTTPEGIEIAAELNQLRKHLTLVEIRNIMNKNKGVYVHDPELAGRVNDKMTQHWESNDGGQVNKKGKYAVSTDRNGAYSNWRAYKRNINSAVVQNHLSTTYTVPANFENKIQRKDNGEIDTKAMQATPNGVFDHRHIRGTFEHEEFSAEMYAIAKRLNTPITELFRDAMNALGSGNDKDKALQQRYNLDAKDMAKGNFQKSWAANGEMNTITALKSIVGKDAIEQEAALDDKQRKAQRIEGKFLLRKLELQGWNRLRPSEKLKIYKIFLKNQSKFQTKEP